MARRNRTAAQSYLYEDNRFENHFGESTIREVENLIRGVSNNEQTNQRQPQGQVRSEIQEGLSSAIAEIEARYR